MGDYRNADSACVIQTDGICSGSVAPVTTDSDNSLALETWVIIVIALAISVVLGILIVGITCYLKRENAYLPDGKGPMACAAGTSSVSTIGTNLLRISPGSGTPESPENHINDGYRGYRNIPSRGTSRGSSTSPTSSSPTTVSNLPRIET